MLRVPQIDFKSMNFANVVAHESTSPDYEYNGPQYSVQAVVAESMTGSKILELEAPSPNSTWSLEFHGPALSCGNVDAELYASITNSIVSCYMSYGYIAWTSSLTTDDHLPFNNGSLNTPAIGLGPQWEEDGSPEGPLSLYVAALPNMLNTTDNDPGECYVNISNPSQGFANATLHKVSDATIVQCVLGNASYLANFSFVDNVQSVSVERGQIYNNVSYLDGVGGAVLLNATYPNGTMSKEFNTTMVENFAYQAVMNVFNSFLLGDIYTTYYDGGTVNTPMAMTALLNTKVSSPDNHSFFANLSVDAVTPWLREAHAACLILGTYEELTHSMSTQELDFLNYLNREALGYSLSGLISSDWDGLSVTPQTNFTAPMVDVLETMFTNATVSLMHSTTLK
jgi:hypothetical protein